MLSFYGCKCSFFLINFFQFFLINFENSNFLALQVSKLGFGCMGLTGVYNSPVSDEDGISIIKDAFNKGITFFDTADVYGPHTNEVLVGKVCNSASEFLNLLQ